MERESETPSGPPFYYCAALAVGIIVDRRKHLSDQLDMHHVANKKKERKKEIKNHFPSQRGYEPRATAAARKCLRLNTVSKKERKPCKHHHNSCHLGIISSLGCFKEQGFLSQPVERVFHMRGGLCGTDCTLLPAPEILGSGHRGGPGYRAEFA